MTAPAVAPARPGAGSNGKNGQPVVTRPFVAGTRPVDAAVYDQTRALTASTQDLPTFEIPPNGFLRGAYLVVTGTTAGNAATVSFANDAPFNVLDTITFNDTNNKSIVGPMNGWDLKECWKFGGYAFVDDAKSSPIYSATTGAGATGGSFKFILKLPIEIRRRDGAGSLPNKSSSATFDISMRLAASATIYGTAPTTAPSVRVRIEHYGWMDPNAADLRGNAVAQNPPGVQTTQYWSKQSQVIGSGQFNVKLQGMDSYVRNIIFMLVDANGNRVVGDADWPDPFQMVYEVVQPVNRLKDVWQHMIGEEFGYTNPVDTAGGRDSGVYPLPYNYDMGSKPGNETSLGYLPVASATNMSANGTIGGSGAHTLYTYVNKVIPVGGDPLALTGR